MACQPTAAAAFGQRGSKHGLGKSSAGPYQRELCGDVANDQRINDLSAELDEMRNRLTAATHVLAEVEKSSRVMSRAIATRDDPWRLLLCYCLDANGHSQKGRGVLVRTRRAPLSN
jgi:hypothetical protein